MAHQKNSVDDSDWPEVQQINSYAIFMGYLLMGVTLRERQNSPSVAGFPECQKSDTRERESSPSVALGEELHSGKRGFPECLREPGTR